MTIDPAGFDGVSGCYLLCFAQNPVAHARHYLGYADDIARRVGEHAAGSAGARLTTALYRAGGTFSVARVWPGATAADEERMKGRRLRKPSPAMRAHEDPSLNHKRGRAVGRFCPLCAEEYRARERERYRLRRSG